MKKGPIIFLILFVIICSASVIPLSRAQGFDDITHPADVTVERGESVKIQWTVTISSVGSSPTYSVYRNGTTLIADWSWELEGSNHSFSINPITDITPAIYNISITVNDGLGNSTSDDVQMTITPPGSSKNIWVYVIAGGILGAVFLFMFFNKRKIAKMIERNKNLNDNPI